MALATLFPSLSTDGWISDQLRIGDLLLSHFFTADFSQTQLYVGNVSSLPYLLQQYQNSPDDLYNAIQDTLTTYLGRYFSNIIVEAAEHPNPTDSVASAFDLYVSYVGNDGVTYTLAAIVESIDSTISNVIRINNYGE